MSNLITANQVISATPLPSDFDAKRLTPHIAKVEYRYLKDNDTGCLGKDMYEALLADQVDYTSYVSTRAYIVGEIVVYEGGLYKCTVGNTGKVPTDTGFWTPTNLFNTAKYQTLWDGYLCELLGYMVVHASIYKVAFQITTQGVQRNEPGSSKPASSGEVRLLKDDYLSDVEVLFRRMDEFLREEKDTYPLYKGNKDCGEACKPRASMGIYLQRTRKEDYYDYD